MKKSYHVSKSKKQIVQEYSESAKLPLDYQKAKWNSSSGMLNQFRLALSSVDWQKVNNWLDVGCNTGLFFVEAENRGLEFTEVIGVDIIPELIQEARNREYANPVYFIESDLENMSGRFKEPFDLVTFMGVLQLCGIRPEIALEKCVDQLNSGGQIFVTTKNVKWQEFTKGHLSPYYGHSWFSYDELVSILKKLKVKTVRSGGFLTNQNRIVPVEESHTMYILGKKN